MEAVMKMDDLVEEILFHFPPTDPASLLRAAVVCRRWCRIISAGSFRGRFGQRHPSPPMLGVLANIRYEDEEEQEQEQEDRFNYLARFVPATTFRPRRAEQSDRRALDAHHGRVVLTNMPWCGVLNVWDPVTDDLWELPELPLPSPVSWNAAVVCASHGACDHLVCRRGAFRVVFLDTDDAKIRVHVYSSADGAWSEPTYGPPSPGHEVERVPTALVGNSLCFLIDGSSSVLKYDLTTRSVSVTRPPPDFISKFVVLVTMGDGGLGFARVDESRLWVWSLESGPNGDAVWAHRSALRQLDESIANDIVTEIDAFAHGAIVVFGKIGDRWVTFDLKSGRVRKDERGDGEAYGVVVPYTSFYTPDLHRYDVVPARTEISADKPLPLASLEEGSD